MNKGGSKKSLMNIEDRHKHGREQTLLVNTCSRQDRGALRAVAWD